MSKLKVVADNEIKVDKGIPIPPRVGGRRPQKYPFDALEVGDSFFAPGRKGSFGRIMTEARRRNPGAKYSMRAENGGQRVWRVK